MPTGAMGSARRGASRCAEYFAPEAASTLDMITDGATSACGCDPARSRSAGEEEERRGGGAHLVAGVDDDVCAPKEVRDGGGVRVEEALARLGHAVAAPVDLHELGQLAL